MKTPAHKTKMILALALLALGMNAQTTKLKKACVKVEKNENGKVTKIDTCVTGATDAEIRQKLSALGIEEADGLPPLPPLPPVPGKEPVEPVAPLAPGETREVSVTKTLIIDNDNQMVMDGNGKAMPNGADADGRVAVKTLKKGEKPDAATQKILSDNHINMEGRQMLVRGADHQEIRVLIVKKVEVGSLSDGDKKQLPREASKSITAGIPFNNLSIAPNPTDDACHISYRSNGKDPLQIRVYDMNGKTVLTETDTDVEGQVSKSLSLKDLGPGTYFIHLSQGKQSEVSKIVVMQQ